MEEGNHFSVAATPNSSWKDVVGALQQMGENTLAERIEQKYITASNLHQPVTISISLFTLCAHVQSDVKQLVFSICQSVIHQNHSNCDLDSFKV